MIIHDPQYEELSRQAHAWRARIDAPEATTADEEALQVWLSQDIRHEEAFDRTRTLWSALDMLSPEDLDDSLLDMPKVQSKARVATALSWLLRKPRYGAALLAAAAIAVILLGKGLGFFPREYGGDGRLLASHDTRLGETKEITLPDGSRVILGAATQIEMVFTSTKRHITLASGAAYFDVSIDPARPFSVAAGALTATVRGTQFDVRCNGDVVRVGVAEGLVDVAYPLIVNGETMDMLARRKLSQNEAVAATPVEGLRDVQRLDPGDVAAWRSHTLTYSGGTLRELIADANRYTPQPIVIAPSASKHANLTLTASFDAKNIDRMLAMLSAAFPIQVDKSTPGKITIKARDAL